LEKCFCETFSKKIRRKKKSLFIRVKSSLLKGNGFRGIFCCFYTFRFLLFLLPGDAVGQADRKQKAKVIIILIKNYRERVVDRVVVEKILVNMAGG
jgi:hypothetical protein